MICTEVYIEQFDWLVHCFFAVDRYYVSSILSVLNDIGCSDETYERSSRNLNSGQLDTGLTFSNGNKRESILVVGLASSPAEYDNSIAHEFRHLEDGIASASGVSLSGEDVAYLAGEIRYALHNVTSALTCECHCREKMIKQLKSLYSVRRFKSLDR